MEGAISHLKKRLLTIRAGKASPAMLQSVMVDYYGSQTPLSQVANVNTPDGRTISIQPWEKSIIADIERAIFNSNLGFNPMNNGESIIINVPPLTEERRINVTKVVARDGEDAKIALRNKRHDARKHLDLQLKAEEISRDQKTGRERDIDEVVKKYNDEVDRMVKAKSEEVMKI
jgi:ribosome recycling factor